MTVSLISKHFSAVQSDDSDDDDQPKEDDEPDVPEPERDAALEEAYKLEKEDADSDEVDSDDDDEVKPIVELSKEEKREAEVSVIKKRSYF